MRPPENFTKVVDGKRYNTATAQLIASDAYWDGHNWERGGRNRFLYRTPKGAYFAVYLTCWQGEHDTLEPLDVDSALELWEQLAQTPSGDIAPVEEAFPGVEIEEA